MSVIVEWLKKQVSRHADLRLDSRDIQKGDVFVACKGSRQDGTQFIQNAIDNGAAAIVLEQTGVPLHYDVPCLSVSGLREQLGQTADVWYHKPSKSLTVIAVTGTNGKTSCVNYLANALNLNGIACATIGTLGTILPNGKNLGGHLTTPDVMSMHRTLADLVERGIQVVAMEASSIGLEQGRLDGVRIKVAGFTNLSLDHLDYHYTMQEYERCKALLFRYHNLQEAVINLDNAVGQRFWLSSQAQKTLGYSMHNQENAQIFAHHAAYSQDGLQFDLQLPDGQATLRTALVGEHNVANLLLCAGILHCLGWSVTEIASRLSALDSVPGRLEVVRAPAQFNSAELPLVVVDYSHTPDSLERAIVALKPSTQALAGKLHCVFGCGGDRDNTKRSIMGKIAAEQTDFAYVTSDNPRTEDPQAILDQILMAMPADTPADVDRGYMILHAIFKAAPNDVILIAGKGHETYQEINHVKHAFDDRQWALLGLLLRTGASVNTDSRQLEAGQIFVALKGENFNAHDFLPAVAQSGALAALVSHKHPELALLQILVDDTQKALEVMGKAWRSAFNLPVIAVTGSNGKTTTKEMIAAILQAHYGSDHYLATQGNFNNHIGVPLSLLKLRAEHRAAVFELGMNHPGEIALLADLAQAQVALVNNAQREHQEFMKTVEAVALENGQVIQALPTDGIAVFPNDEPFSALWYELAAARTDLSFGNEQANVFATELQLHALGSRFMLNYQALQDTSSSSPLAVSLSIPGVHNVRNALAAAACALAIGIPLSTIVRGLAAFKAVKGRMQGYALATDVSLIDDTYNANPDSVVAAIDVLARLPQPTVLILGDMGEVGQEGPQMHIEMAQYAKQQGISALLMMGQATALSVSHFGSQAYHFDEIKPLLEQLEKIQAKTILVKGSRFMRMERVVHALREKSVQGATDVI